MRPAPTLSIALCTHNGGQYLETQLLSILEQAPLGTEVIVSDDASTDDTVAIAERTALGFPTARLRILRNLTPLGVTANFEQAIRACTGDIIALSDQDDRWHADRLARLLAVFENEDDVLVVASDARLVDAVGEPLGHSLLEALEVSDRELRQLNGEHPFDALLRRNLLTGATMAFRRGLLDDALPFPASWVHDEWLAAVAAATSRIRLLETQLIDYRQHGSNQIGAVRISFRGKLGRLFEPRAERNARLLARASALADRLSTIPAPPPVAAAARAKLEHERMRSGLPAARILRLARVARALRAGDYSRFGRGRADAARDLLQPAR